MDDNLKFDIVHGYKIQQAVCFENGHGFALGVNSSSPFPIATWFYDEINGKRAFHLGHYFPKKDADLAAFDLSERVKDFKKDNPGAVEKYNYLAAAEMSGEINYNAIDGVINNEKPSILERLRNPLPLPTEKCKSDTSAEIER